jgi:hypothetical protein
MESASICTKTAQTPLKSSISRQRDNDDNEDNIIAGDPFLGFNTERVDRQERGEIPSPGGTNSNLRSVHSSSK